MGEAPRAPDGSLSSSRRRFLTTALSIGGLCLATTRAGADWTVEADVVHEPTVVDGIVYGVGADGRVSAIDADSGDVRWHRQFSREWENLELSMELQYWVQVVNGWCIAIDDEGRVLRIDAETGEHEVTIDVIESAPVGGPVVHRGICYVQTGNTVHAVDLLDEELLWEQPGIGGGPNLRNPAVAHPAIAPQTPAIAPCRTLLREIVSLIGPS